MSKKSKIDKTIAAADPKARLEKKLADLKAKLAEKDRALKEQQKLLDRQRKSMDAAAKARYKLPKSTRAAARGQFYRIILPDTHGCFIDDRAFAAVLGDLEFLSSQAKEVVLLGDHVDCGGFLAQHQTIAYVAEATYSYEDDVNAANQFLDVVQAACPKAAFHYLFGNHERRVEKWCVTQALRHAKDAEYLNSLFGVEHVLHLDKRNINYYRQSERYSGCRAPGTIKLGQCYFTHGSRSGIFSARSMLNRFNACIVFGHVHKRQYFENPSVRDEVAAWCPGCLTRLQPLWRHTDPTDWSHGYGLQIVQKDGSFLHINVPIIDGKSYLGQLAGRFAA